MNDKNNTRDPVRKGKRCDAVNSDRLKDNYVTVLSSDSPSMFLMKIEMAEFFDVMLSSNPRI